MQQLTTIVLNDEAYTILMRKTKYGDSIKMVRKGSYRGHIGDRSIAHHLMETPEKLNALLSGKTVHV